MKRAEVPGHGDLCHPKGCSRFDGVFPLRRRDILWVTPGFASGDGGRSPPYAPVVRARYARASSRAAGVPIS